MTDSKAPSWGELSPENRAFIEKLYNRYLDDPSSVDSSWKPLFDAYFDGDDRALNGQAPSFEPPSIFHGRGEPKRSVAEGLFFDELHDTRIHTPDRSAEFAAKIETMIRAFRLHGHLGANLDPLERGRPPAPDELDPSYYGFSDSDMNTTVRCEALFGEQERTLREVVDRLRSLYCDTIGVEYESIPKDQQRRWLETRIERQDYAEFSDEERRTCLEYLLRADAFEHFIHQKHVGSKRFSVTGVDSLIPMMNSLFEYFGTHGAEDIVFGMAHRGRLNVLHNIMGKSAEAMLSEFERSPNPEAHLGSSDVKYHMGYSADFELQEGGQLHVSLCFNPSHLEYVNPVLMGRTRAKQKRRGLPESRQKVIPLLLHGDAAFAGQGIVSESLNMARLEGFSVGGTIHIVINNQLGFTTEPEEGRSTMYATDVAKSLGVPIFHVNADDPEACCRVMKLAAAYRQKFEDDVVIDLIGYRRYGHNEGDEPRYTQPLMYEQIEEHSLVRQIYAEKLRQEGLVSQEDIDDFWDSRMERYGAAYQKIQDEPLEKKVSSGEGVWEEYQGGTVDVPIGVDTSVERDRLERIGLELADVPEDFSVHRTLRRLLRFRREMAQGERPLDWGMAEALAYGSLVGEGAAVRMSGQDSVRGTFSHRHAALHDTETGEAYWPHRHIFEDQADFEVYNSMLSEAGVLGFEYGVSLDTPDGLVLWEAQFGDFANGAQVIIDQFISSGEDKWQRLSGLTMLLPHGYEGQGPEHSSARLERYLQLCAEGNMFVCNLTTPAQFFHVLRRQVLSTVRKPLIIMTPKSLLRHKEAVSSLEQLSDENFKHILPEARENVDPGQVDRVLLCSGKVYYDLLAHAREHDIDNAAIIRVEQLHPLNRDPLKEAVEKYDSADELCWVQEEPRNMGAWFFMQPKLRELFAGSFDVEYVGRVESSSPATGSPASHEYEQDKLIREAFGQ